MKKLPLRIAGTALIVASLLNAGCSSRETNTASPDQKYCAFSQRLDQQSAPPTDKQFATLKRLAPAGIRGDVVALVEKHDASAETRLGR